MTPLIRAGHWTFAGRSRYAGRRMTDIGPDDLLAFLETVSDAPLAAVRSVISLRCALGQPLPLRTYQVLQRIFSDHEAGGLIGSVDTAG